LTLDANGSTTNLDSYSNANLCPSHRDIHSCQPNCYAYSHINSAECHTFTHTYSNPDDRRVRYGIDTAGRVFSRE
jgi:hypothetical protein